MTLPRILVTVNVTRTHASLSARVAATLGIRNEP